MIHRLKAERLELLRFTVAALAFLVAAGTATAAGAGKATGAPLTPSFSKAVAFDVSLPLSSLARKAPLRKLPPVTSQEPIEIRPERGPVVRDQGYSGDGALQSERPKGAVPAIPGPLANFEGLSNQDNFNVLGGRVNPPDPNGDVGPNHYVEMINLVFGVYDKTGNLLLGPVETGTLWSGFAIPDCTDPSGDPVVIYDQFEDRWLLSQFTTRGPVFYNCVAVSATGDPTGAYYRYAFDTTFDGLFYFPDYPKYGVWTNSYLLTSRDFGPTVEYGISVYALEKSKMIAGDPNARAVHFFIDGNAPGQLPLVGDGLLPADIDGTRRPADTSPAPLVGTMEDGGGYGAPFDGLNIWELSVEWNTTPVATLALAAQPPVAAFDSIFPCAPTSRDCLPQPGIVDPARYLDILSYRQRPTFRLGYRNFGGYEALVTNQSVEALPGVAGVRWYEVRRTGGAYSIHQQGTYAPNDGVHRWMGSVAQNAGGDIALGYSVVNGTDVFPGIRYTGRLFGDPPGLLPLGEGVIINGSGVQTTTNSRWGDYTDMTIDPTDDCTFWYVNEYYTAAGQASSPAGWQTRIGSFKLPGCVATLTDLSPAKVWVGLKNSGDQGTQFDVRAEILKNGTAVAEGLQRCLTGVTRNPNLAKETNIPFTPFGPVTFGAGDVLSVRFSTRIGTNPDNTKCAGPGGSHNNAVGLRLYYDSTSRQSHFDATIAPNSNQDYYLHSDGNPCANAESTGVTTRFLDTNPPVAASAKCKDSLGVNFAGGNPFSTIGTWSLPPLP
jgi:hypothetical protein